MPRLDQPTRAFRDRRAARERRAADREAIRGEFELQPRPRGLAALRALAAGVGALEEARVRSHRRAADAAPSAAPVPARTAMR